MNDLTQVCESSALAEKKPNEGARSSFAGGSDTRVVEPRLGKNKTPKRVGYLCEKIGSEENVAAAVRDYCRGQRSPRKRKAALRVWNERGKELCDALKRGAWEPSPLRRFEHRDGLSGKTRIITSSSVADNIAQTAIVRVVEPVLYRSAWAHSCCNVKGKGIAHIVRYVKKVRADDALRERYAKAHGGKPPKREAKHFLKFDCSKFYASISPELCERLLESRIKDKACVAQIMRFVRQNEPNGLSIGGRMSHMLANFTGEKIVRALQDFGARKIAVYMDDFVVFASSKAKLHAARKGAEFFMNGIGLAMKGNWFVSPWSARGCDFCGYVFDGDGRVRIRKRIRLRIIRVLRRIATGLFSKKTARSFLSYWGYILATKSFYLMRKYGGAKFNLKRIKERAK